MVPDGLRIYELFDGNHHFYSIHTLDMLKQDKDYFKQYLSERVGNMKEAIKDIDQIKKHISEYSLNPYLALNGLDSNFDESETYARLTGLIANLWEKDTNIKDGEIWRAGGNKKLNYFIRRVQSPGGDMKFLGKMLNMITSDNNRGDFQDSKKAEELFMEYANEESLPLIIEKLKLVSGLYNRFGHGPESLDD